MWSVYTGQQPYVFRAGMLLPNTLFPHFPKSTPPEYRSLAESCLRRDPHQRPTFAEIKASLMAIFNKELGTGYKVDAGMSSTAGAGPPWPTSPALPLPVEAQQSGITAVGSGARPAVGSGAALAAMMSSHDEESEPFTFDHCESRSLLASCLLDSELQACASEQQQQQQSGGPVAAPEAAGRMQQQQQGAGGSSYDSSSSGAQQQ